MPLGGTLARVMVSPLLWTLPMVVVYVIAGCHWARAGTGRRLWRAFVIVLALPVVAVAHFMCGVMPIVAFVPHAAKLMVLLCWALVVPVVIGGVWMRRTGSRPAVRPNRFHAVLNKIGAAGLLAVVLAPLVNWYRPVAHPPDVYPSTLPAPRQHLDAVLPAVIARSDLPREVSFDVMTRDEVARAQAQLDGYCAAWFFIESPDTREPVAVVTMDPKYRTPGPGAVKLNRALREAKAAFGVEADDQRTSYPGGFIVDNFAPITQPTRRPPDYRQRLELQLHGQAFVATRRAPCTIGWKSCRRYEGVFKAIWSDEGYSGRARGEAHPPFRLIVEDACPLSKGALLEGKNFGDPLIEAAYRFWNVGPPF